MITILPKNLITLAELLPVPLYVVGGSCRDFIAGLRRKTPDWDVCAPIDYQTFCQVATDVGFTIDGTYKNTGTVKLHKDGDGLEFSSFRSDDYVRGTHSPTRTHFTNDVNVDALRRDFKCNAIYYDVKSREFVDPLGGIADVKNKIIDTVRDADRVFGEDGLRLMRLARHCAETGFSPTANCTSGARKNCLLLKDISAERIWTELDLILHADEKYGVKNGHYNGLKILHRTGVLNVILPELCLGDGLKQNEKYHRYDVLEHSLATAKYAHPCVRFAALLHDVGKPETMIKYGNAHGHDEVGAKIAVNICKRLKTPTKLTEKTVELIRLHMYDLDCKTSENKVRRFIVANNAILNELLLLKQADFSGSMDDLSTAPTVLRWQRIYGEMKKEGVPFSLKELKVKGDELILCGIEKRYVGKTLLKLLSACATDAKLNDKEKLLKLALSKGFAN